MRVLYAAIAVLALVACKQEGPAEKAGRAVDKAGESASKSMEKAGKSVRDAVTPDKK